ncbi:uncharacterized protein EI97DRAFT_504434 [Westerdykella ornata]|uniref:Uncharacterized protein n=1 Tax=Westerdykella ornata TaxID=318751 RepID=A0A6A6J7J4_WESOR|nr:uncharacterized protein EI97DRAFT_504434 [Westerdykella ornata]KAF2272204.1 hypothetical protein EI97DRAFT_504434 [Westerdykella ornata]
MFFTILFALLSSPLFWVWLLPLIPNMIALFYAKQRGYVRVTLFCMARFLLFIVLVGMTMEYFNFSAYTGMLCAFCVPIIFNQDARDLIDDYHTILKDLPVRAILHDLVAARQALQPAIWSAYERIYEALPVPDKYLVESKTHRNVADERHPTVPAEPTPSNTPQQGNEDMQARIDALTQERDGLVIEKIHLTGKLNSVRRSAGFRESELETELAEAKEHIEQLKRESQAKDEAIVEKNGLIEKHEEESLSKDRRIAKLNMALNMNNAVIDNIATKLGLKIDGDVVTALQMFVEGKNSQFDDLNKALSRKDMDIAALMSQANSHFAAMTADFQKKETYLQAQIDRVSTEHKKDVQRLEAQLETMNTKVEHFDKVLSCVRNLLAPTADHDYRDATIYALYALLKQGVTADDLGFDAVCMAELNQLFAEKVENCPSPFRNKTQPTPPIHQQPAPSLWPRPQQAQPHFSQSAPTIMQPQKAPTPAPPITMSSFYQRRTAPQPQPTGSNIFGISNAHAMFGMHR